MTPQLWGGGHIEFGMDPVGVGVGMTISCLDNILRTSGWILTIFSWMCNWDKQSTDKVLVTRPDLIFKVTAIEK